MISILPLFSLIYMPMRRDYLDIAWISPFRSLRGCLVSVDREWRGPIHEQVDHAAAYVGKVLEEDLNELVNLHALCLHVLMHSDGHARMLA